MAFYKDREQYLQDISENHPLVAHNQLIDQDGTDTRRSFYRINGEEEFEAAVQHWIHFPCVIDIAFYGGFINKGGLIRQQNFNTIRFLDKLNYDPTYPIKSTAVTNAYDRAWQVMQDYIQQINADYEDNPGCGIFANIDLGKFKWEQVGPVDDQLYGWDLTFPDETKPFKSGVFIPSKTIKDAVTFSYTATGTEGTQLIVPDLEGKKILWLSRSNYIYDLVDENPAIDEVQRTGLSGEFNFVVALGQGEKIRIMYLN